MHDAMRDAREHGSKYGLRHYKIAPEQPMTGDDARAVLTKLGQEFRFDPARALLVEHQKSRAGGNGYERHWHALVPEYDPVAGRVLDWHQSFPRHEKIARQAEQRLGHDLVPGRHNAAVAAAVADSQPELARRLDIAAALPLPSSAYSTAGHQMAARRGHSLPADKLGIAQSWQRSDSPQAFAAALAEKGITVRQGDKPGTYIAEREGALIGAVHRLVGAKKGEVAERLAGADLRVLVQPEQPAPLPPEAARPLTADLAPLAPDPRQSIPSVTEQASPADAAHPAATSAVGETTASAPSWDARSEAARTGGSAPAAPNESVGGGGGSLSIESIDGPGEPPGPGASIQEVQRWRERLIAYEERKGQAYARQQAALATENERNKNGGTTHAHVQAQASAATGAPNALAIFTAGRHAWPEARANSTVGTKSGDGTHGQPVVGRDTRDEGQGPGGGEPVGEPDGTAPGRGPKPDNGNPGSPHGHAGVATPDGTAARGARAHARQAIQARAAQARLAAGVAAQPDALAALRYATRELDPAWRERRDAWQRIRADRARIAAIMATHPHPDSLERNPAARAASYAGRLSDGYRERQTAAEEAQAEALAARHGRSKGTRLLSMFGISTPEQRHALAAVALALKLTDEAERQQPTPADYREARTAGTADAYAAQARTRAWEAVPDVAAALEQHRLNQAVDAAAQNGHSEVTRALRAGDHDAARAIILAREEAERLQREEQELQQGIRRDGPGGHGAGGPPPGPRGLR